MTSFADLGLAEPILKALEGEGYATPTPIQAKAIPLILAGRDVLGIAQTGTGKTAAFALPILHRLAAERRPAPRRGCRALVLSPTRELATQIADNFRAYGRHLGLSTVAVFGGTPHRPQIYALSRGVDILVATPGRLIDHILERHAALEGTEIFVLDEADQMLDLGFLKPIRQIVARLAVRRQSLFFSATMPAEIASLAGDLLINPEKVAITPVATTAERVAQRVIHVEAARKRELLTELLADPRMERTLVFTRTKRGADRLARHLESAGLRVAAIHGNKNQRQRENALEAFRKSRISILVATDIAARGIDVDLVTHVVNYELPEVPEVYVHRIGRTARAGASGTAISLCDGAERDLLRAIERLTRQKIASECRPGAAFTADGAPRAAILSKTPIETGGRRGRRHDGHPQARAHFAACARDVGRQSVRLDPETSAGGSPRKADRVETRMSAQQKSRAGDRPPRRDHIPTRPSHPARNSGRRPRDDDDGKGPSARPAAHRKERSFAGRDRYRQHRDQVRFDAEVE